MGIASDPSDLIVATNVSNFRVCASERNRGSNQLFHGGNRQRLSRKTHQPEIDSL